MTSERVICTGCGTDMTDADLAELKQRDPRVLSCCPERKMMTGVFCVPCDEMCFAPECLERGCMAQTADA